MMSWNLYLEAEIMQIQIRDNMQVVTVWIINHENNLPVDTVVWWFVHLSFSNWPQTSLFEQNILIVHSEVMIKIITVHPICFL